MYSSFRSGMGLEIMLLLIMLMALFIPLQVFSQDQADLMLTKEEEEKLRIETMEDLLPGIDGKSRFLYEPEGRRDPFLSLLLGKQVTDTGKPDGIEGFNVSELVLTGILNWGERGRIALFRGPDNRTYQRSVDRCCNKVYDGTVTSITKNTVVFEQKVYDPFGKEKPSKIIEIKLHPKKEEGL